MYNNEPLLFPRITEEDFRNDPTQINASGYALPFRPEGRKVVKMGVKMNVQNLTVEEWVWE